jgi:RNA polymerase sigma-70 factor (ECF subfamily)
MDDQALEAFFNEVYDLYHRAVFAFILTRVGEREISKDLLQEAFLRAWNQIHVGYGMGRNNCRFWIYKITKNLVTDYYRRCSSREHAEDRMRQEAAIRRPFGRSPEEFYEIKSNVRRIEEAVNRLPDALRSVLILHMVGEMNSAEIGELLEIPAGTARYRISMARKRLMLDLTKNESMKGGRAVEGFGLE